MTPVLNMSANSSGLGSIMEEGFHTASARSGRWRTTGCRLTTRSLAIRCVGQCRKDGLSAAAMPRIAATAILECKDHLRVDQSALSPAPHPSPTLAAKEGTTVDLEQPQNRLLCTLIMLCPADDLTAFWIAKGVMPPDLDTKSYWPVLPIVDQ
jgi:hypothetical protein